MTETVRKQTSWPSIYHSSYIRFVLVLQTNESFLFFVQSISLFVMRDKRIVSPVLIILPLATAMVNWNPITWGLILDGSEALQFTWKSIASRVIDARDFY